MSTQYITSEILKISKLLRKPLNLPNYQRPYKWKTTHVQQLLNDLWLHFDNKKIYRIGTVILYQNTDNAEIVDGQQRLTTLTLLLKLLGESESNLKLLEQEYRHTISQDNIIQNYQSIDYFLKSKATNRQELFKRYILDTCEMVCVELNNLDEAFQFFDSQNARGKSLEAYDLLKAYHLREMQGKTEAVIHQCVEEWEKAALGKEQSPNLHKIINHILFRLRVWQQGQSGEEFTCNELFIFKGVSEKAKYPYVQATQLTFLDKRHKACFQAKQTIINGEWFFAYIQHYLNMYRNLFDEKEGILSQIQQINGHLLGKNLITFLNTHKYAYRTGDRYLRGLFECLVLAYFDKFGEDKLESFIFKAFIWVYRIRIEWQRITFATIDKKIMSENSLLTHLEYSNTPDSVMMFNYFPDIQLNFNNVDETIKIILNI